MSLKAVCKILDWCVLWKNVLAHNIQVTVWPIEEKSKIFFSNIILESKNIFVEFRLETKDVEKVDGDSRGNAEQIVIQSSFTKAISVNHIAN